MGNSKKYRWLVRVVALFAIAWVIFALSSQQRKVKLTETERRQMGESSRVLSAKLQAFFDAKGRYPTDLIELDVDPAITRNWKYWTNAQGGYSLVYHGTNVSSSSTAVANTP